MSDERNDFWHTIGAAMYKGMGTFLHDQYDEDSGEYTYQEFVSDPVAWLSNEEDFDMTNQRFCRMVDTVVAAVKEAKR